MLAAMLGALVLCREYLGAFMTWLAHLHGWSGPAIFVALFVLVAFPMMWGYIVLNVAAGYLYGLWRGVALTACSATFGALVSFVLCRRFFVEYIANTISSYENFKQIVRVIEGRQGFRIIIMARLTPVPFGLQNALFSVGHKGRRRRRRRKEGERENREKKQETRENKIPETTSFTTLLFFSVFCLHFFFFLCCFLFMWA